jgi:hypothetical protein
MLITSRDVPVGRAVISSAMTPNDQLTEFAVDLETAMQSASETADRFGDDCCAVLNLIRRARDTDSSGQRDAALLVLRFWLSTQTARLAGRAAFRKGAPRGSCPYMDDTIGSRMLADAWNSGWEEYRREFEDGIGLICTMNGHTVVAHPDIKSKIATLEQVTPGVQDAVDELALRLVEQPMICGVREQCVSDDVETVVEYEVERRHRITCVGLRPKQHAFAF